MFSTPFKKDLYRPTVSTTVSDLGALSMVGPNYVSTYHPSLQSTTFAPQPTTQFIS